MKRAGGVLMVGLPGPVLDRPASALLARLQPAGVIFFGRNFVDRTQSLELVAAVRAVAPGALFFVDAEGGRVDRLKKLVGPAPAAATLATQPPAAARRAGRWVGQSMRGFDLDVDLAPVVDLDHGAVDNALDGRYFGANPRAVVARGRAFIAGLHRAGVGACVKHFPGLGAARADTHHGLAVVDLGSAAQRRDLLPFAELATETGAVLLSHAIYPHLDDHSGLPATLSFRIATRLLRRRLRFHGVAISDDLEMGALKSWGDPPELAASALAAGCDLLPICSRLDDVPAVARRLERSAALRPRLAEAAVRVRRYREATLRRRARGP